MSMRSAGETLVVGYGNTLRGDDGLGPEVARQIADLRLCHVRVVIAHQLLPELAEPLAAASRAFFVDACCESLDAVTIEPLCILGCEAFATHFFEPRALLSLAQRLFGRSPPAWLVSITGVDFGFSERLTRIGQQRAHDAAERLAALLTDDLYLEKSS